MADALQSAVAFQLHWTLVPQTQETERQVANIGSQARTQKAQGPRQVLFICCAGLFG